MALCVDELVHADKLAVMANYRGVKCEVPNEIQEV